MKTKRQGQSKLFVVLATLLAIVFFSFAGETDVKAAETYTQNYTPTRKSPLKKIEYINRGDNTFDINVTVDLSVYYPNDVLGVQEYDLTAWTNGTKGIDYPNEQYEKLSEIVEMALQKELLSLIQQGKHVVLDFSFWNKANRAYYKRLIEKAGGTPELVYMKASKGTLQKRLYKRNQSLNANSPFIITNEILEHHYNDFQEPCGEGEKVILQEEDCVRTAIDSPDHLWW